MKFAKIYLLVPITLLFSSFIAGHYDSLEYKVTRLVHSGPNKVESPVAANFHPLALKNVGVKKLPNLGEPLAQQNLRKSTMRGFGSFHNVSSGPTPSNNDRALPPTMDSSYIKRPPPATDSSSIYRNLEETSVQSNPWKFTTRGFGSFHDVPNGPNPIQNHRLPPAMDSSSIDRNLEETSVQSNPWKFTTRGFGSFHDVPNGPNPIQNHRPPPATDSSSIDQNLEETSVQSNS
ncbi:hypothetical protein F0562_013077 [Nyssa sinensis]|uniref:Uncharacterized protein n=1 Tax=Nyssa sinensis TaxID=561372 RepID=A0A5J4ZYN2_9ASTE|nr:hypothetical protein F0562_013077 [Nyssa sinensis]